ncbi:MAG TPA: S9 family peptidase [Pyrinomonadaceae bacterium]|nr:S9 family peptidase [Pyrinomonadaceae bacterium]
MRRTFAALCCLVLFAAPVSRAQNSKQTSAPEDTPTAVAGDIGLAGAPCPDIARYLNVRSASAPSLAPDGSRVAFRTRVTGTPQIWVADVRTAGAPRQITFGESVTFHEWSPDGRWIAYGVDRGGNEREGFYLISPEGEREIELLAPSESFRVWGGFSHDASQIAFAATEPGSDDFSIYTVNLKAASPRPVRAYAGQGGIFVGAWRPDGSGLILTRTRGEDANDVLYLDLRTGKAETLFQPDVAANYDSFEWTADGRGFYMSTDQDRDFSGLAYFDFVRRQLTWVETPSRDVEQVALSPDGRFLAWTENAEGFSEIRLRDLRTKRTASLTPTVARRLNARATEAPVRGVVNALEWAARAPVLAIQLSAPGVPGDVWAFDATRARVAEIIFNSGPNSVRGSFVSNSGAARRGRGSRVVGNVIPGGNVLAARAASGALVRVTESSLAGLDPARFVAPAAVSFPSHDGVNIHGLLYTPPGASAAKRAPVVLSVHGGPTAQARPDFDEVLQYLLARGYAVLDLNFRGSTGYGKRFARLDNGRLRPNAVRDMAAAVEWLARSNHPVDASRTAVMGGSYGGYMTLAALTQLPDKFRAGVNFVGVSNWVTALEGASPQLKASDRIEYGNIDDPADREFFKQLSPLTHVANIRAPLMVLHGANDPRDPVAEADQIVRAVRGRGGEVEYLRFPDEGHGIRKLSNRVIAYRRVARFLERHLGRGVADCGKQ